MNKIPLKKTFSLSNLFFQTKYITAFAILFFALATSCSSPTKVFKSEMQRDYDDNLYWLEFHCFKDNTWECVKMTQGDTAAVLYTGTYTGNVFRDTGEQNPVAFRITNYYSVTDKKLLSLPPFLQREDAVTIKKGNLDWEGILQNMSRS